MKPIFLLLILFLLSGYSLIAQSCIVTGFVKDSISHEPLIGASVYLENTTLGTTTNGYGFFSLKVPENFKNSKLAISYTGCRANSWELQGLKNNQTYYLLQVIDLSEVEVTYKRRIEESPNMSMMKLSMKEIHFMPQLFQEDLIKSIQFLPGIQGGTEGGAGMYVRGGSVDQNLILLDDVPLYYVNHAGNMISIFDNNAIKDFQLYKGAFPARYGGRLSSVLDIRMKEGDKNHYHGEVGLGLLSGNVFLEGPIVKNKSSFFISYRKFWPEYMLNIVSKYMMGDTRYSYGFDDLSAKISTDFSDKDKLLISFYRGGDKMTIKYLPALADSSSGLTTTNWSNMVGAIKYTRVLTNKIFSDLTVYYTQYNYLNGSEYNYINEGDSTFNKFYIRYNSKVRDLSAKLEMDFIPSSKLKFKFGGQFIAHRYTPGSSEYNTIDGVAPLDTIDFKNIEAIEPTCFIESDYLPNKNFELNIGLRNSYFIVEDKTYPTLEPRILLRYNFEKLFAVKASYAEMVQTIHLLNYSGAGMPSDLWLPPTSQLEPGKSKQIALGFYKTLEKGMYEISIEGYYKYLENMIAYKDGASFFAGTEDWQTKLENGGTGISEGIELYVQKNSGKLTGWFSYTLAKTNRHFQNKNNGKPYPFNYDRRHSISVVGNYKLNEKLVFSGTWTFGSGYPITLASTQYPTFRSQSSYKGDLDFYGDVFYMDHYGDINSVRMRSSHHLDVALTYTKKKQKTERVWNFTIYNLYNRQNPYFYYYEKNGKGGVKLKQQSYFPIMPSISYTLKF